MRRRLLPRYGGSAPQIRSRRDLVRFIFILDFP
jgi:hypothetical protein